MAAGVSMWFFGLVACQVQEVAVEPPPPSYPDDVIALVGVRVLTMIPDEPVLDNRTVVIHDGLVLDLPAADVVLPASATVVDVAGATVMPGLIDAHVHTWYEGDLLVLLANGVTTVRNLFGDPLQKQWRNQIRRGDRLGPSLVTAGPIVDGSPPLWATSDVVAVPADAEPVVVAQADDGYDLIKVYNNLGADAWRAVLDAAQAQGLPVAGHVPWDVGWNEVVASDQLTIEHLDGLVDVVGDTGAATFLYDVPAMTAAMDARDDARLRVAAEEAAADGVYLVPTLVVMERFLTADETAQWQADPRMRYVHPDMARSWAFLPPLDAVTDDMLARYERELEDYTLALQEAGASIALGTDTGNAYVIPGFSVHDELELLVRAGLTPYEALAAGTVNAAGALGLADRGTVAVGQRADLLVLAEDPSEDVRHAQDRLGLVLAGEWHDELDLAEQLDALAAEYAARSAAPPGTVRPPTCAHAR